jgi:hypothetical protein
MPPLTSTFLFRLGCPVTFTGGPAHQDVFVGVPGFDTVPRNEALILLRAAYGRVTIEEFAKFCAELDRHVERVEAAESNSCPPVIAETFGRSALS